MWGGNQLVLLLASFAGNLCKWSRRKWSDFVIKNALLFGYVGEGCRSEILTWQSSKNVAITSWSCSRLLKQMCMETTFGYTSHSELTSRPRYVIYSLGRKASKVSSTIWRNVDIWLNQFRKKYSGQLKTLITKGKCIMLIVDFLIVQRLTTLGPAFWEKAHITVNCIITQMIEIRNKNERHHVVKLAGHTMECNVNLPSSIAGKIFHTIPFHTWNLPFHLPYFCIPSVKLTPYANTSGLGLKPLPWAWYFTKSLLPLQRKLIVFAYFLLVNLST